LLSQRRNRMSLSVWSRTPALLLQFGRGRGRQRLGFERSLVEAPGARLGRPSGCAVERIRVDEQERRPLGYFRGTYLQLP
jgi:hypothetical protein